MPFPDYTSAECKARVIELDAQIAQVTRLASAFTLDKKSFDYKGKLAELRDERALWVRRYEAAEGTGGTSLEGPRIVPV